MMRDLTVAGAAWALDRIDSEDEHAKIVARVAVNAFAGQADDWPIEFQEQAIIVCNDEGAKREAGRPV